MEHPRHSQKLSRVYTLGVCLLVTVHTQQAFAESIALKEETALFIAEGILLPLAVVPAIVAATANATLASKGQRPSRAWQILGWATGGINAGVGLLFTITGATTDRTALWIAGVSHLAIGITTMALTFWGWTLPTEPQIVIGPMLGFDRTGGSVRIEPRGLSVSVMAW